MTEATFSSPQEVQQSIQPVLKQARIDATFRQRCLSDPHAAVQQVTGKALPDGYKLRFVENEGADMTLVLPDPVAEVLLQQLFEDIKILL